jgi:hypothetical protein
MLSGFAGGVAPDFRANLDGVNWAGYAALGTGYRSVAATWTVPTVTCSSSNDVVGAWVGLGGIASSAVEQTGVEAGCATGRPRYRAWVELAPAPPVYYRRPVAPGDVLTLTPRPTTKAGIRGRPLGEATSVTQQAEQPLTRRHVLYTLDLYVQRQSALQSQKTA